MTVKSWNTESRTIMICVDSYERGILQGRIYNPIASEGKTFQSLSGFILEMEQILEGIEFPKSYTITRTFATPQERATPSTDAVFQEGALSTFALRILFRQNASWQGSVVWLEEKQEQSFRSVLELILLFDNALTQKQAG